MRGWGNVRSHGIIQLRNKRWEDTCRGEGMDKWEKQMGNCKESGKMQWRL